MAVRKGNASTIYNCAWIVAILASCYDAYAAAALNKAYTPPLGLDLLLDIITVPGDFCAFAVNTIILGTLRMSAQRMFILSLPFNFLWMSCWAWMVNGLIDEWNRPPSESRR